MTSQPKYASFWTRFTAYVLDGLILGIPFVLIIMPLIYSVAFDAEELKKQMESEDVRGFFLLYSSIVKAAILSLLTWAVMLALITCTRWQATPGKRIMEVYVSDADGGKPKFMQCFLRYAALPILILTIQTPERYYIYDNLQQMADNASATKEDLQLSFTTPISGLVSLLCFVVICAWYSLIAFRPQKTAGHDILFNTRVVYGRK